MSKTKFCFNTFYLRMSAKFCGKIARTNPNFNTKHLTKKNQKICENQRENTNFKSELQHKASHRIDNCIFIQVFFIILFPFSSSNLKKIADN